MDEYEMWNNLQKKKMRNFEIASYFCFLVFTVRRSAQRDILYLLVSSFIARELFPPVLTPWTRVIQGVNHPPCPEKKYKRKEKVETNPRPILWPGYRYVWRIIFTLRRRKFNFPPGSYPDATLRDGSER